MGTISSRVFVHVSLDGSSSNPFITFSQTWTQLVTSVTRLPLVWIEGVEFNQE